MSAGGSMRFSGYFDFYFNAIQTGGDVVQQVNFIDQRTQNFTQTVQSSTAATMNYGSSLRRLALDFRLISSSIRQVVSAMGLQDTVVGKAASGIVVLASSITGIISLYNVWNRLNTQFAGPILGAAMQAVTMYQGALAALGLTTASLIPILLLIAAGVLAVNYVWRETSGINRYRESIKNLEEDVEDLEDSLKSLRLEQGQLGVQSAALAAEQAKLDAQLATGTITAEEHAAQSEILDANRAVLGAQTAELTFNERYYQSQLDQSKASIDDYEQAIKDTNQAKWDILTGKTGRGVGPQGMQSGQQQQRGPGILDYFWSLLGFESGGIVSATGPIMAHAGEQVIPAGEVGGGPVSLTISLEGANIYGREGMEEALQVGGEKIRKQLEYMRRPRTRW